MMDEVFEKIDMEALFQKHNPGCGHLSDSDIGLLRTGFARGVTSVNSEITCVAELFDEKITVSLTKALRRKIIAFSLNTINSAVLRIQTKK